MRNKEETVVADSGDLVKEMGDLTSQWIKGKDHKHEQVAEMLANNIDMDGESKHGYNNWIYLSTPTVSWLGQIAPRRATQAGLFCSTICIYNFRKEIGRRAKLSKN